MPANALIHEASPYLRQHAHNPVDWLPWSDAAFTRAALLDRPVFLSIGYSACHWCHVMERESFEDITIAAFLNEHFICIKVDREERPDVDHHYMQAVQSMTGQGGWPLSVFLTAERRPFFGGTYWPPVSAWHKPGFLDVLHAIADAWHARRRDLVSIADQIHQTIAASHQLHERTGTASEELLHSGVQASAKRFDSTEGGFGPAPKFPHAMELSFLLRQWARDGNEQALAMSVFTLEKMMQGGIYDHLGGGFHRYSTDAEWHVPHFEKMLYDNALLVPVYLDAYLITRNDEFRRVAQETLDWALREMETDEGGFAASLDADSEGEEGRFYCWTSAEVDEALGPSGGERFCQIYGVSREVADKESASVLRQRQSLQTAAVSYGLSEQEVSHRLAQDRNTLLAVRQRRTPPARDDKVLTDWNSLMISALVRGYTVLRDERYLSAANRAARCLTNSFVATGKLQHSQLGDRFNDTQLLLDYAALGNGLLDLFMVTGDPSGFDLSVRLARQVDTLFSGDSPPYMMSAAPVAGITPVDPYDGAIPSGISLAGNLFAKLYHLTGDDWYLARAKAQVQPLADSMERVPSAFSQGMLTVELLLEPPVQLVLVEDARRILWSVVRDRYLPQTLVLWINSERSHAPTELTSLLAGKVLHRDKPTAYLCRHFTCDQPVSSPDALEVMLDRAFRKRPSTP